MKRPTTVTVFGVLNIVFACVGGCQLGFTFAQPAIQKAMGVEAQENPIVKAMEDDPNVKVVQQIGIATLSLASLVQLAAGIGLLRMRSWGRTISIWYAAYDILSKIVFAALNFMFLQQAINGVPNLQADAGPVGVFMGVFMGCFLIFALVYPILLLIFMNRANVKAAFSGEPGDGDMMDIPDDNPYANPPS